MNLERLVEEFRNSEEHMANQDLLAIADAWRKAANKLEEEMDDGINFDEREKEILRKALRPHRDDTDEHYYLYEKVKEWQNE